MVAWNLFVIRQSVRLNARISITIANQTCVQFVAEKKANECIYPHSSLLTPLRKSTATNSDNTRDGGESW